MPINIKTLLGAVFAVMLLAGCATHDKQCCMMPHTKLSMEQARKAALAKVPGTVKEGKLEKYKGKDYWTFDIATKGSKKITEVAVDPNTGKVVWSGVE